MTQTIRIMTYNVHSCIGTDRRISPERIAEVILRAAPDVVALQEVDRGLTRTGRADQAQEIAGRIEMYAHFHPSVCRDGGEYGNALLSRFPLSCVRSGNLPVPRQLQHIEHRGAIWIEISLPEGPVQIIATHLGLVRGERHLQGRALLGPEWLGHPACTHPVILCGDLNTSPRSHVYQHFARRFRDVQCGLSGWHPKNTWPSRHPLRRIDHIFVTPEFAVEEVSVPRDEFTRKASDHLPLVAAVRLTGAGTGGAGS